jgi:beta propeller repeat protein
LLVAKEDSLRATIRKEVEDEFTKGCVSLDTTGYYCLKDKSSSSGALTPSTVITDVSSEPDTSGSYKQIFMTMGGERTQLTHDSWDNTFPTIDVSGKSLVWQGNVSGRWQVFYASVATSGIPEVLQLTHSNESNFNPKVDGDDVVWQGWVNGNWEIFFAHRLTPNAYYSTSTLPEVNTMLGIDTTWSVTRITNNGGHDMFPSVAGGLVTWQSFTDNAWNVYVYSVKTGATVQLSKGGEKNENPRFAITWDARKEGGNARMVGYDIATGKTIDLTEEARTVNDNKPYTPTAPITAQDQAALPITNTGTSTTAKSEGDGTGSSTPNGLDV